VAIPDEEIAQVRAATDIVALISEQVALRKRGGRWVGLCPFHQERTPSFSVNAEEGLYHCFGCQASGDAISFVRETEHVDFAEAVQRLAERANITLHDTRDSRQAAKNRHRERIFQVLETATAFYHRHLVESAEAAPAREYLESRGYGRQVWERFRLGFSPTAFDALPSALDIGTELLVEAGIGFLNRRGRFQDGFRGRLIFPIFDTAGKPVAFGGRLVPGVALEGDQEPPKYRNSPETPVYSKRRILYGLNWAKRSVVAKGEIVVCEGYTDVIGCHLAGIDNAVATCGTSLTEEHLSVLRKFAPRIVLAYDSDGAGLAGTDRVYGWEADNFVTVAVASLPTGCDPADLARDDPPGLANAVANAEPFLLFRVRRILDAHRLDTVDGRARAFEQALEAIAAHPSEPMRDQVFLFAAQRVGYVTEDERRRARRMLDVRVAAVSKSSKRSPSARSSNAATEPSPPPKPDHLARSPAARVESEALRLVLELGKPFGEALDGCLFSVPELRRCYEELRAAKWDPHAARQQLDEPGASVLARLAVEDIRSTPDDVWRRLIDRASVRALEEIDRQVHMHPESFRVLLADKLAVRRALEALRDTRDPESSSAAGATLLSWLVERDRGQGDDAAVDHDETMSTTFHPLPVSG
jgi:DNA primase